MGKRLVIKLSGNSCTGKSSLIELLSKEFNNSYRLSSDKFKWGISNYNRNVKRHRLIVKNLTRGLFEAVCKERVTIFLDTFIKSKTEYDKYVKIANRYGYHIVNIKLIASADILLKRFRARIKSAKRAGSKVSVTDERVFIKNILRKFYTPKDAMVIDTSGGDVRAYADRILRNLKRM